MSMASSATTSNVVRLPTAARRKVQQPMNAAGRAARKAFRDEAPWPGKLIFPGQRQAMKLAEAIADLEPSAELELLIAVCSALDDATRLRVIELLAPRAVLGRKTAEQALAILRTTRMTVGEAVDFDNAWRQLNSSNERP
jgi:hypothetical protein